MGDPHKFYLRRRSYNQCHQEWLDAMAALSGKKDVSQEDRPDEPDPEEQVKDYAKRRGE